MLKHVYNMHELQGVELLLELYQLHDDEPNVATGVCSVLVGLAFYCKISNIKHDRCIPNVGSNEQKCQECELKYFVHSRHVNNPELNVLFGYVAQSDAINPPSSPGRIPGFQNSALVGH